MFVLVNSRGTEQLSGALPQELCGYRHSIYRMRSEVRPRHLAEFGLNIRMQPWLLVRGSRKTLPWAAKQFDHLEKRKRDD